MALYSPSKAKQAAMADQPAPPQEKGSAPSRRPRKITNFDDVGSRHAASPRGNTSDAKQQATTPARTTLPVAPVAAARRPAPPKTVELVAETTKHEPANERSPLWNLICLTIYYLAYAALFVGCAAVTYVFNRAVVEPIARARHNVNDWWAGKKAAFAEGEYDEILTILGIVTECLGHWAYLAMGACFLIAPTYCILWTWKGLRKVWMAIARVVDRVVDAGFEAIFGRLFDEDVVSESMTSAVGEVGIDVWGFVIFGMLSGLVSWLTTVPADSGY